MSETLIIKSKLKAAATHIFHEYGWGFRQLYKLSENVYAVEIGPTRLEAMGKDLSPEARAEFVSWKNEIERIHRARIMVNWYPNGYADISCDSHDTSDSE